MAGAAAVPRSGGALIPKNGTIRQHNIVARVLSCIGRPWMSWGGPILTAPHSGLLCPSRGSCVPRISSLAVTSRVALLAVRS